MRRFLIIPVALITMGTAANATTLAAGAIYGGTTQAVANCYLYNADDSAVSVLQSQIIRHAAGPVPLASNSCGVRSLPEVFVISQRVLLIL